MSHHSSEEPREEPSEEQQRAQREAQRDMHESMERLFGEFPDGKMNTQDEGALALTIGIENGKIVIRFPKPIAWIGFTEVEARQIIQSLVDNVRKISKTPFSIRL